MKKPFNIHDWQAKRRLTEEDEFQKRQDRLTPGKNPGEFYGDESIDEPRFPDLTLPSKDCCQALTPIVNPNVSA